MCDIWIWDNWALVMRHSDPRGFSLGHKALGDLDLRNVDTIYLRLGHLYLGHLALIYLGLGHLDLRKFDLDIWTSSGKIRPVTF